MANDLTAEVLHLAHERGSKPQAAMTNLGPNCLLLVEDDPLVRLTVAMLMEDYGFQVSQAATAEEAISVMEGGLDAPVLVTDVGRLPMEHGVDHADELVTDVDLGAGLTGPQLADHLRKRRPDLLVVFITGRPASLGGRPTGPREAMLPKPFEAGALASLVNRMVTSWSGVP